MYVFCLLGIGKVLSHSAKFPKNTSEVLNAFVLNIALPAIILLNVPNVVLDSRVWTPFAFHWVLLIIHFIILYGLNVLFKWDKKTFATLLVVTTLGNTAFIGIPLNKQLFGEDAVPYAVIYDQLGSGIAFILYSAFLIPFLKGNKPDSIRSVAKNLITFPPFVALALGFILNGVEYHQDIKRVLEGLSSCLVPAAMISVGYQIQLKLSRQVALQMGIGLLVKLLCIPLIALGIIKVFNFQGIAVDVSLLQSGMAPMITGGVLAIVNKLDEKLTTSLVGYGIIISFATISLIQAIA